MLATTAGSFSTFIHYHGVHHEQRPHPATHGTRHTAHGKRTQRSLWRLLLTLVFFVVIGHQGVAQPSGGSSDCREEQVNCTAPWQYNYFVATIPEFPSCPLTINYRVRDCGPNTFYYQLFDIDWQIPDINNPNDPSNPCYDLHNAYTSSFDQDQFLQQLFHSALKRLATLLFDQRFTWAQNELALDPNNPNAQAKYQSFLCPNGQKIFRATYATCMAVLTRNIPVEFHRIDTSGGKKDAQPFASMPPDLQVPVRISNRYYSCNGEVQCCLREFKICYDVPQQRQVFSWQTAVPSDADICPIDPPDAEIIRQSNPGARLGPCRPYCDESEFTPPKNAPDSPGLSKK